MFILSQVSSSILETAMLTISLGKLKVAELLFEVPKDYSKPDAGTLHIFARSVEKAEKPIDPEEEKPKLLPWCKNHVHFLNS